MSTWKRPRLIRGGMPAEEADRLARATFGGIERQKDDARDSVGLRVLDDLAQDLRYAVRQLRASPGFTAATIVTLALGVGATTTIFAIERTVTASDLAFARPGELVHLAQGTGGDCNACWRLAKGNYMTVRDESRTLVGVTLVADWSAILRGPEHTEIVSGALVTPEMFQVLGIPAMLGRTITPADTSADGRYVVVLAENLGETASPRTPGSSAPRSSSTPFHGRSSASSPTASRFRSGLSSGRRAFSCLRMRAIGRGRTTTRSRALRPGVALPQARAGARGGSARASRPSIRTP